MQVEDAIKRLDVEKKSKLVTGAGFWCTRECAEIGMPSVKVSDGPNGMRVQEKRPNHIGLGGSLPATCYPTASASACSFDEELGFEVGRHIAKEAAAQNVSMVLGPGLNIKRSPLCGRNFEYFSEDSYLSGKMAAAYVKGIQSTGVTACIKHFAANCREHARLYYDARVDEQTLREIYLTGFEIAVKEGGVGAVMTAYNSLNGEHCNQSGYLLNDVLRGEWGFNGVVVSDWGGSINPVKAIEAGADLEMPACKISAPYIERAVKDGELDERLLDKSVERICAFARRSQEIVRQPFSVEEHHAFAREVAEKSMVLLKNEGGALPLKDGERVAIVGGFAKKMRYQGAGSSQVIPTKLTNFLSASKSGMSVVGYAEGFKRFGGKSKKLINGAVKLSKKADTYIVCLGLDENREAEGADRQDLKINDNQTELLKALKNTGKKIVAVLFCGSAVETGWDEYADALLLAHLPGQAGAEAAANILTGKVNPSGRLAETYPQKSGDEACAAVYDTSPLKTDFTEGIYVGYKYYTPFEVQVKYPFGYGLSYTTFSYEDFKIERDGASVTIKNTGSVGGATVAQLYIKAPRKNVKTSPYELKAFKKVYLEAGEEARVHLPFDEYSFRVWDGAAHRFCKGGEYIISLRENARDELFCGKIVIDGEGETGCEALDYEAYCISHATPDLQPATGKRKLVATPYMQVADLSYCKGITAKLFGYIAKVTKRSKNKMTAGVLDWMRVRSLMQFMGLNAVQAEGFIMMCNGKFFKGLGKLLKKKG